MGISGQRSHCSTAFRQIPARRPRYTRTRKSPACCGSRAHSCWFPSGTRRCLRQKHAEEEDADRKGWLTCVLPLDAFSCETLQLTGCYS